MRSLLFIFGLCISTFASAEQPVRAKLAVLSTAFDEAMATLSHYQARNLNGNLSKHEAQVLAKDAISKIQVSVGSGYTYYFIFDENLKMLMHPIKPSFAGRDFSQTTDVKGKLIFVEFLKAASANDKSVVDYYWNPPKCNKPMKKMAMLRRFESWGWIIGTSTYVSNACDAKAKLK